MTDESISNEWGTVLRHGDVLELRWLPTSAEMGDAGFMATTCLFVHEAERARARGLLVDAMEFRHRFGEGLMAWRDANVTPRYGGAGVRRFAFVVPEANPNVGKEMREGNAVFTTRWFSRREDALAWLAAR